MQCNCWWAERTWDNYLRLIICTRLVEPINSISDCSRHVCCYAGMKGKACWPNRWWEGWKEPCDALNTSISVFLLTTSSTAAFPQHTSLSQTNYMWALLNTELLQLLELFAEPTPFPQCHKLRVTRRPGFPSPTLAMRSLRKPPKAKITLHYQLRMGRRDRSLGLYVRLRTEELKSSLLSGKKFVGQILYI